jgi:hypothetical protein
MNNRFVQIFLIFFVCFQLSCAEQVTKTTITVVSEDDLPIQGANVSITYAFYGNKKNIIGKGISDVEGKYTFSGESLAKFFVTVTKEGYYESRYQGMVYTVEDRQQVLFGPEVVLTLKEIKDPIPMFAQGKLEFVIPEPNKEFGFDLEVADWVAPYGTGKSTDVIFSVNGYYNGRNDNESRLVVSFPNEGDGLMKIEGNYRKGSKLMSPHTAPEEGYSPIKEWGKSRKDNPDVGKYEYPKFKIIDDHQEEGINYLFRVRTVLDPQGKVISAHYGKIYGDFHFFGAHEDGSFIAVDAIYFNPTMNDRNLEYAVGENLVKNLKSFEEPRLP